MAFVVIDLQVVYNNIHRHLLVINSTRTFFL